ncbi:unnamed protein product [Coffea canephora]|uniref:Uncharacterized protein n=1 Tax=Coffea canephora TaxID=49390 RepID=A0A068U739_COFCA|nr:unnamed protein product [Coffea canephora]
MYFCRIYFLLVLEFGVFCLVTPGYLLGVEMELLIQLELRWALMPSSLTHMWVMQILKFKMLSSEHLVNVLWMIYL